MTQITRVCTFRPQVSRTIWHTEFIGDVGLVSCCPLASGDVGRSMPWHAECFMRVMFQTRFLAIQFFGKEGRPRDDETPPIGSAGTPTRKRRTSIQAKETGSGTERPNRSTPRSRRRRFKTCRVDARNRPKADRHGADRVPRDADCF